jgi:hypothetical protein
MLHAPIVDRKEWSCKVSTSSRAGNHGHLLPNSNILGEYAECGNTIIQNSHKRVMGNKAEWYFEGGVKLKDCGDAVRLQSEASYGTRLPRNPAGKRKVQQNFPKKV